MAGLKKLWWAFDGWRYRRWLKTPEGQRYVAVMGWLASNAESTTIHTLAPETYAKWGPEVSERSEDQ